MIAWIVLALAVGSSARPEMGGWKQHPLKSLVSSRMKPYDKAVRPPGENGMDDPVSIQANVFVRDVEPLASTKDRQALKLQVTLRQTWKDPRLAFGKFVSTSSEESSPEEFALLGDDVNKIWIPDTFIRESRETKVQDYSSPNRYVRISPDGTVLLSERVSATLACPENSVAVERFDKVTCTFTIASYGLSTKHISYQWREERPVNLAKQLEEPGLEFNLSESKTEDSSISTATGTYSAITWRVTFEKTK